MSNLTNVNGVAWSSDGTTLVVSGNGVAVSTNAGTTWVYSDITNVHFGPIASSADGTRLVALTTHGPFSRGLIYTSADSGRTWMPTSASSNNWRAVASSADGASLVAVADGSIYTSGDSGATWTSNNAPGLNWSCVASSADGCKLVAGNTGTNYFNNGQIYTSQTVPSPVLNLGHSSTNAVVSWIVPSIPFALQQNFDLTTTNWEHVTISPALNPATLRHEVTVAPTNSGEFYRLRNF